MWCMFEVVLETSFHGEARVSDLDGRCGTRMHGRQSNRSSFFHDRAKEFLKELTEYGGNIL